MSLNKAKEHYSALIKGSKIKINIQEWEKTIYMRPIHHLNVSVASKIKTFTAMENAIGAAKTLAALATTTEADENDNFSFSKADLHDLINNVNGEVLMRTYFEWVAKSNELLVEESAAIKK